MSKVTLNSIADITQSTTAQTTINTDLSTIQTAFDNTLSRDGSTPNQMGAALDMNSNQIVNLPSPTSNNSPVRLVDISALTAGGTINISPLPTGGTVNQLLTKNSSANFDASWQTNINVGTITASGSVLTSGANRNVISSGILAGNLCVGSNFAAAQPYVFNVLDNQAPADSRRMFFGFDDLTRPVNGSWYTMACGSGGGNQFVPVTQGGALGIFASEVDIGIDNTTTPTNNCTGHWFKHTVSKGTGAGGIALLVQSFANAGYTPSGTLSNSGVAGAQINAFTSVGGFTFGCVIGAQSLADAAGYTNAQVGLEVDNDMRISTNGSQVGIQVISQNSSGIGSPTIAGDNVGYYLAKSSGTGYKIGFQLGATAGGTATFPLLSTGSIIKTTCTNTIASGIDFSTLTISGNALATPGFALDGTGVPTFLSATAVPVGGTAGKGIKISSVSNLGVFFGSGVPTLAAAQGSLYIRTDGSSTSTRMYINTNGSTTWTNVTTAA